MFNIIKWDEVKMLFQERKIDYEEKKSSLPYLIEIILAQSGRTNQEKSIDLNKRITDLSDFYKLIRNLNSKDIEKLTKFNQDILKKIKEIFDNVTILETTKRKLDENSKMNTTKFSMSGTKSISEHFIKIEDLPSNRGSFGKVEVYENKLKLGEKFAIKKIYYKGNFEFYFNQT